MPVLCKLFGNASIMGNKILLTCILTRKHILFIKKLLKTFKILDVIKIINNITFEAINRFL